MEKLPKGLSGKEVGLKVKVELIYSLNTSVYKGSLVYKRNVNVDLMFCQLSFVQRHGIGFGSLAYLASSHRHAENVFLKKKSGSTPLLTNGARHFILLLCSSDCITDIERNRESYIYPTQEVQSISQK